MSNKQSSTQADYIVGLKGLQGKYICKMGSGDKVKLRLDPGCVYTFEIHS